MAHIEQVKWVLHVRDLFPEHFKNKRVLDIGSLDINGNNKPFFTNCYYLGCDIAPGKNVDIECPAHALHFRDGFFNTIISTESFEHDMYVASTLINIRRLLAEGGLFVFTCATTGRTEHGTVRTTPSDSPLTSLHGIEWENYYENITEELVCEILKPDIYFSNYKFDIETNHHDLRFWGIRNDKI